MEEEIMEEENKDAETHEEGKEEEKEVSEGEDEGN